VFSGANTAGDLIVVSIFWSNTGAVSVSDSRGNVYAVGASRRTWGSGASAQIFYSPNIGAGANTVTVTFATAIASYAIIYIHEYAGLDVTSPLDGSAAGSGTTLAMSAGRVATTVAGDLLFAAGASSAAVTAAGSGWTTRSTFAGNRTQDEVAGAPGPYSATATQNGNSWVLQEVALRPAPAGADATPPTASIASPATGAQLGGIVSVSATAADNVGVAGVLFLVDGVAIGAEDLTAPYSIAWNTTTVADGTHALTARARDGAGNTTLSASVSVSIANGSGPPLGLVAGYAFDDGLGTVAADASGNGIIGTLANGATWAPGRYNGSIAFDGLDDQVDLGNPGSLQLTGSMTISAWINSDAFPVDDAAVVSKRGSVGFQLDTTIDRGPRTIGFKLTSTSGAGMYRYGATTMQTAAWYFIAGVYDATAATLSVYINGQLDNGSLIGTVTTAQQNSSLGVRIGGTPTGSSRFDGRIDEVRIYSRALTAAEIQADMARGLGSGSGDSTPPTVSISAPAAGAQVSNIVGVTAAASDNVGVTGVQFLVDGLATGIEDTSAPYALSWDTRASSNGAHTLSARARDLAGNTSTSAGVTVNVTNATGFQNEILATGFTLPTQIRFMPDGRMLVAELAGRIRMLPPPFTTPDPTPFLVITNICTTCIQQGILDFALDPAFATNHFYYVFYTLGTPNVDRLSRFTANATNSGTDAASELVLYQDPEVAGFEHHGGAITFGNDGKLYFTTGDHVFGTNSQLLTSPRGKIHRINKDGTIPTDNPFYDGAGPNVDSIWALGLRNPYRASFDAQSNRLYIGDVGGNDYSTAVEEIDIGAARANYGWPDHEGPCSAPCQSPFFSYAHNGRDSAVTGGFVYRGSQFPAAYQGDYFFADYTQNWIRRLDLDANGNLIGVVPFEPADGSVDGPYGDIVSLIEGPDGALYYVDLGYSDLTGTFGVSKIRRIRYSSSNQPPIAVAAADPTNGPPPLSVNFSSSGSSDPEGQPLTYAWTFGDGGASIAANPTHLYNQAGSYTVRLAVSDGVSQTIAPPLTVTVGTPPVATIQSPVDGSFFVAGQVISFSGTGTDPEDGTLPASAFTWNIDFLHAGHVHPNAPITGVKNGTFVIPTSGHDFSGLTRYRFTLTVVDLAGLSSSTSVTIWPTKVNLTFTTNPAGLTLYLDEIAKATPFVYDTLVGFNQTIEARNQTSGSTPYVFASWSDGGAQQHTLIVPATDQTYTAMFTVASIATPAFVQVRAATPQVNVGLVTVSYATAQSVGNSNIIAVGWNSATSTIAAVTDTKGNAYRLAAPIARGNGLSQAIYYASGIGAASAGANAVTVTFSAAVPYADVRITEYSGLDPINPLDQAASAAGNAATANSGAVTTAFPAELLFGAGITYGSFGASGTGFTTRIITRPDADIVNDRIVTATGSYAASATVSGSWVMQFATFKAAGQ
jgi:glucose/arabinose dehydrogenase/PKD repeat protein